MQNMSDEKLFSYCQRYGAIALKYRNKFAGLLPEVFRRNLYIKKGFSSIFEFAAKLAGMSEEQVRRVLNLERKFEAMPVLREMLVRGEVSVSKLAKVASIVTTENQEDVARQVRLLPRSALETLVRDEKAFRESKSVPGNTHLQQNPKSANISGNNAANYFSSDVRDAYTDMNNEEIASKIPSEPVLQHLHLSPEVHKKLFELQQKGIDINALLLEFIEKRDLEIAREKEEIAAQIAEKNTDKSSLLPRGVAVVSSTAEKSSRYIPVRIREILKKEHGTKCSVKNCKKPSEEIHHTQRYSLDQSHNPQFLAPLCHEHHVIAHSIDMKFHNQRLNKCSL